MPTTSFWFHTEHIPADKLQKALKTVDKAANSLGLYISPAKTKTISFNTSRQSQAKFKGHRKRFPKLIKLFVLYIKINFSQRYIKFFSRNKVTVVLKLALLASHMAELLIENLRKTLECDILFAKQRRQTLYVALLNLCYVFYIVFIKHIKWFIVSHTIVQRNIHQVPMIISDV